MSKPKLSDYVNPDDPLVDAVYSDLTDLGSKQAIADLITHVLAEREGAGLREFRKWVADGHAEKLFTGAREDAVLAKIDELLARQPQETPDLIDHEVACRDYTFRLPESNVDRCHDCAHVSLRHDGSATCGLLNIDIANARKSRCPAWTASKPQETPAPAAAPSEPRIYHPTCMVDGCRQLWTTPHATREGHGYCDDHAGHAQAAAPAPAPTAGVTEETIEAWGAECVEQPLPKEKRWYAVSIDQIDDALTIMRTLLAERDGALLKIGLLNATVAERDSACQEIDAIAKITGDIRNEDRAAVEAVRRLKTEVERLRATNRELNRRAQRAEAGVRQNVEACKVSGVSMGRTLARAAAGMAQDEVKRLRAAASDLVACLGRPNPTNQSDIRVTKDGGRRFSACAERLIAALQPAPAAPAAASRPHWVRIDPFRNNDGSLCGLCDGAYIHDHPMVKCSRCGAEGLQENWPFDCCGVEALERERKDGGDGR